VQQKHSGIVGFVDAVGEENFYLELQFNRLKQQHLVNHHILRHADQTGVKLISTADSHYYSPDKWEARELYKKLGWMGNDPSPLPEFEDLKCELYPKNALQMWNEFTRHYDEYKETYEGFEQTIKDSIEITHDITWDKCEDCWIDTNVKLEASGRPFESKAPKFTPSLATDKDLCVTLIFKTPKIKGQKERLKRILKARRQFHLSKVRRLVYPE